MLEAKVGVSLPLVNQAPDGETGLYCRAKVYDASASTVLATVSLVHAVNGLYVGAYVPSAEGYQHVVAEFYEDAGFTTPAEEYGIAEEDILVRVKDVEDVRKLLNNRWVIERSTSQIVIYDDDGTTELFRFQLKDETGAASLGTLAEGSVHERTPL